MVRRFAPFALLAALCACGPKPSDGAGTTPTADGKKALTVGVVFDSGGRGDKSFNDSAYKGIERAKKDFGIVEKPVDSRTAKDYENNLATLADGGADMVVAVGISMKNAVEAVAPKFPDVKFALVDAEVESPNVRNLLFAEEEGSFLAGTAAALATKTKKIGFVGGKNIPLIEKFAAGYIAGAKDADPAIVVLAPRYTESWDDTAAGRAAAEALYAQGADVVFHAAGRCGLGVIQAAKEKGKLAIGVDSDQDDVAPGAVLTSMVKRVDEGVYRSVEDLKNGKFSPGAVRYDLKADGVGLTDFRHTLERIGGEEGKKKIEAAKARVIAGEVKVPATLTK